MRYKLIKLFKDGIHSIDPSNLIKNNVKIINNAGDLQICDQLLENNINFHILGFGKAIYPMAESLQYILKHRIKSGVLSIPVINSNVNLESINVMKGALNNLPDENAVLATNEIIKLALNIPKEDVVLVLISGGGSSLLCKPVSTITLNDKLQTINLLTSSGANIRELNSVRKRLSQVKGGGLGYILQNNKTICLVLSDVIGSPLDVIASGPVIKNTDSNSEPLEVVRKYKLELKIPKHIMAIIKNPADEVSFDESNIIHRILGSNEIALKTILEIEEERTKKVLLSTKVEGLVRIVSKTYLDLVKLIIQYLRLKDRTSFQNLRSWVRENSFLQIESDFLNNIAMASGVLELDSIIILMGGETTVEVYGSGKGGRNQELAVLFAQGLDEIRHEIADYEVTILCGGTDGIDGPTDAAGGIGCLQLIEAGQKIGINVEEYLRNNDSYSYLSKVAGGQYLIKVGHTGTNVMDIHMIAIKKK